MAWPKNLGTFGSENIGAVRAAYREMILALCKGERVHLMVDDQETQDFVRSFVRADDNLVFHRLRSEDVWVRDYAPIFVKNGQVEAIKWKFNAWGRKYDDLLADDATGVELARQTGLEVTKLGLVLEGGSIDVNGRGTLMTTKQCLLNKNRNSGRGASEVKSALRNYLGARKLLWLEEGIAGDDTDGHVDDVARFVAEDTVVCMREPDKGDPNHTTLSRNLALLKQSTTLDGRRLKVVELPTPHPIESEVGRLPASYANFYIANAVVLVPTFDDTRDGEALSVMSNLFPARKIVGIDCRALVRGLGTIHCVTQQQPAGTRGDAPTDGNAMRSS